MAADGVDAVEGGRVTGDDVPLEDPHHRWRFEAEGLDALLGVRADVQAGGDRLARAAEAGGDGRSRRGVGREGLPHPVRGDLRRVGGRVPREPRGPVRVQVVHLPEPGPQVERHGAGAQRAAVLRPVPHPFDVGVGREERLQRLRLLGHQVVRECTEPLELAAGLELDDAPLVADGHRRVERQVAVEVAHRVLGRHDQVRVVDRAEHRLVRRGVGVQVADRADTDGPRPEDDVAVVLAGSGQQRLEHRLHGRLGGHGELGGVVPARLVDGPALADADHEPVDERHAVEQLGQPGLVDGPQRGVVDGQAADGPLQVRLERGRDGEHVREQVDVHAHVRGVLEHRPEGGDHRLRTGDVRIALGVHLVTVADAAERHVLEEAGYDDAVVPLAQVVLDELRELRVDVVDDRLVDPRRLGQHGAGHDVGVEGVVGARRERVRVGLASDRPGVREPQPEPGLLRRARGVQRRAGADAVGDLVQPDRRPRRRRGLDGVAAARVLAEPVGLGRVGEGRHDPHGEVGTAVRGGGRGRRRRLSAVDEGVGHRRRRQGDPVVVGNLDRGDRGRTGRGSRLQARRGVHRGRGCLPARSSVPAPARRPRRPGRRERARRRRRPRVRALRARDGSETPAQFRNLTRVRVSRVTVA